jgi:hypothetical protein
MAEATVVMTAMPMSAIPAMARGDLTQADCGGAAPKYKRPMPAAIDRPTTAVVQVA